MGKGLTAVEQRAYYAGVARKLRQDRRAAKLTQTELAALLGVHRNTVMNFETGAAIDLWMWKRLREVLDERKRMVRTRTAIPVLRRATA